MSFSAGLALPKLASAKLAAAAASIPALSIPSCDILFVLVRITGYAGADIASLRFNGDTGANYRTQFITGTAVATPVFAGTPAGTVASATLLRLYAATTTLQRVSGTFITNFATTSKVARIDGYTSTGSAATQGVIELGSGEWVNTTAQITSVQLITAGGLNMNVGSGIAVYGDNF
jgi:hypothetical protein